MKKINLVSKYLKFNISSIYRLILSKPKQATWRSFKNARLLYLYLFGSLFKLSQTSDTQNPRKYLKKSHGKNKFP